MQSPSIPFNLKYISLWILLAVIWSTSYAFIKIGIRDLNPTTLVAARMLVAACFLYLFMRLQKLELPKQKSQWFHFLVIGALGNVIPFFLISWGEVHVDSGLAAVLMGIAPVLTVYLGHLVLDDEPLTFSSSVGVLLGIVGVIVLVGFDVVVAGIGKNLPGQIAILCAAICYALTTLYVRKYLTLSFPVMAAGSAIVGFCMISPFSLYNELQTNSSLPTYTSFFVVLYLGLISTAMANLIYFYLINRIGAKRIAQINFVVPVLGALIGIIWLGELFRWSMLVAVMSILSAIYLVNRA